MIEDDLFCVRAEINLYLVWGPIDLFFVWVVEIALVFVWGRKSLGCSVIEIDLVFVWVFEIDLISGPEWL